MLDGRAIALRLGYGHADSMSMHLKHVVDVRVEPGLRVHLLVNNLAKLAERESASLNFAHWIAWDDMVTSRSIFPL